MNIRNATLEDAAGLLAIYDYYVRETAITFEYETPSLEEFRRRMENIMGQFPYLVAEDEDGTLLGYAYAGRFHERAAYARCCELTIYLDREARGRGLGRTLYERLESALKAMGMLNLYACIGYPETEDEYLTRNSAQFHQHLGFTEIGHFHQCGYKFGRWYDMIWMEKLIGAHDVRTPSSDCPPNDMDI